MKSTFKARRIFTLPAAGLLLAAMLVQAADASKQPARTPPAWLRDGVIYEIFPRDFSSAGDLNGVTAQLDRLKDLGVTILWTMPIQPIGEKGRKGSLGSPYSIKDYYAVDPAQTRPESHHGCGSQPHRVGQRVDAAPGILQAGCEWKNHPAPAGMDRRGRFELCQPAVARIHDRDVQILDSNL
jgi:hypothetical protein